MPFEIDIKENSDSVIARLKRIGKKTRIKVAKRVGKIFFDETKNILNQRRYTLTQLAKLGHPFSVRFPKDHIGDDREVSKQSGRLLRGLKRTTGKRKDGETISITSTAPYSKALITGSKLMRPRNFFSLAFENGIKKLNKTQKKFMDELEHNWKKEK